MHSSLGPHWPQPRAAEVSGLEQLLDLAGSRGMRVMLVLNNTHMEEQPSLNSQQWLGAILRAVKDKPALDLVTFGGDRRELDNLPPFDGARDSCDFSGLELRTPVELSGTHGLASGVGFLGTLTVTWSSVIDDFMFLIPSRVNRDFAASS